MTIFGALKGALERVEAGADALTHEVLAAVDREVAKVEADVMGFLDDLKKHAARNPEPIFALLRKVKPILIVKGLAVVTRFEDVQEVLSRDDVFHVTYDEKMRVITGGEDFFLGMQNSPAYERDVAHMRSVMRREDIGRITKFVQQTASEIAAGAGDRIDLVPQLSRVVPARWIADYFGCRPPSDKQLADWGSAIFQYLFTDLNNDPVVGKVAREASAEARAWLETCIADRKAHPDPKDDVLGRCLALQAAGFPGMDDLNIRNNLIGLITGAIPTTSKCCAHALDQLLDRPEALQGARDAAAADNDELLGRYVFEALRFNPNNPGVFRVTAEDYPLAKGSMHGVTIKKGTPVIACTQSAMFDERIVDKPHEFRIDRPPYLDMHFGYGLHTCSGEHINRVQIPAILKAVLKRGARRAGPMEYAGPFPSSLPLTFATTATTGA